MIFTIFIEKKQQNCFFPSKIICFKQFVCIYTVALNETNSLIFYLLDIKTSTTKKKKLLRCKTINLINHKTDIVNEKKIIVGYFSNS